MAKIKLALKQAQSLAERIKAVLDPACERIEIAGSIRREKEIVGDIELVCIPNFNASLFPDVPGDSQLELLLAEMLKQNRLQAGGKNGRNYKKLKIPSRAGLFLDLFITTPAQWGYQFAVRTGSAAFSRQLVQARNQRTMDGRNGLMPSHLHVKEAQYWAGETALQTPTERDVLALCGGWVEPTLRN